MSGAFKPTKPTQKIFLGVCLTNVYTSGSLRRLHVKTPEIHRPTAHKGKTLPTIIASPIAYPVGGQFTAFDARNGAECQCVILRTATPDEYLASAREDPMIADYAICERMAAQCPYFYQVSMD